MGENDRMREAHEQMCRDLKEGATRMGNNPTEAQIRKEATERCESAERRRQENNDRNRHEGRK